MRKKLIALLGTAAMTAAVLTAPVQAKKSELINVDFEDITLNEFKNSTGVTLFTGTDGDEIDIATENAKTGNKAFKIFRKAEKVADADQKNGASDSLGFRIKIPDKVEKGVVRVSFKVRTQDGYSFRSRWKALGSALTSEEKYKAQIVSHITYAYTSGTTYVVGNMNSNKWYTVNYDLYIEDGKVKTGLNADPSKEAPCNAGDFGGLDFIVGYTNPYWESCNSGDLFYWVDDIKVSVEKLSVVSSSVADKAENVSIKAPVTIKFDSNVNATAENIVLSENSSSVEASVAVSGDTVSVSPKNGYKYNSEYSITVKKTIASTSGTNMLSDYVLQFKTKSLINTDLKDGERYTEGYVPAFTEEDDVTYTYKITPEGGEEKEYDKSPLNKIGKYTLKITATDEDNVSEERTISFEIIGAVAPIAENVKITGEPIIGKKLTGSYDYKDENGDAEGSTSFKWYRSKTKDSGFEEIVGETSKEYTLTDADEDAYIKFSVTPVSTNEPYNGEETFSGVFLSAMNPEAKNVKITGDIAEGEELSVSYDYSDENGDKESGSVINWYSLKTETAEPKKIATGETYTLKEEDNNCFIKVGVIPKNAGSGKQEKEFFSEIIAGAFAPEVTDVKILGTVKAESSVGVDYKYFDKNGDPQGKCEIRWYVGGVEVSTSEAYTITSKDKGKKIYVEVTPVSSAAPFKGEAVKSAEKTIESKSTTSVSSGGKNTGSSGGTSTAPTITPVNPEITTKPNETVAVFTDISNHWAKDEILKMAAKGVVNGKSEKTFAPDESVTRAEFAAMCARVLDLGNGENIFSDVAEDAWYKDVAAAMAKAGFMKGSQGLFRPNDYITRQEIAVVLANISRNKGLTATSAAPDFEDADKISEWAKDDVLYVTSLGLLNGISTKYFAPQSDATRAQVVVILSRLSER